MRGKRLLIILAAVLGVVLIAGLMTVVLVTLKLQSALRPQAPNYSAQDLASKAQSQVATGNYQEAKLYLTQALQKNDDHTYRTQLAVVEYQLKDYPEAIAQYQKLIDQKQDMAFSENGIGNAERDWGKTHYADAESAYRASIVADPQYVAAYSNLSLLLNAEGQSAQAVAVVDAGIAATQNTQLQTLRTQLK